MQTFPPFVGERDGDVDVELTMKDADFMQIVAGKLKPDQVCKYVYFNPFFGMKKFTERLFLEKSLLNIYNI